MEGVLRKTDLTLLLCLCNIKTDAGYTIIYSMDIKTTEHNEQILTGKAKLEKRCEYECMCVHMCTHVLCPWTKGGMV